jgi:hypothetical protein
MWTFSCLYPKWKENNTYCSSALRPNHSESVTIGGSEWGAHTVPCCCGSPLQDLLWTASVATCVALVALYCFISVFLALATALSIASFRYSTFDLHSCAPQFSILCSHILYFTKYWLPATKVSGLLADFQLPTVF